MDDQFEIDALLDVDAETGVLLNVYNWFGTLVIDVGTLVCD